LDPVTDLAIIPPVQQELIIQEPKELIIQEPKELIIQEFEIIVPSFDLPASGLYWSS
jgi:hypothetical protein